MSFLLNKYYRNDLDILVKNLTSDSRKIHFFKTSEDLNKIYIRDVDHYAIINLIGKLPDIQVSLHQLRVNCNYQHRVIITYYNYLWEPILKLAELLGLKEKQIQQNWLSLDDIENLLILSDFSVIKKGQRLLLPVYIPVVSSIVNKYLAKMPVIRRLCLTNYIVARPTSVNKKNNYSVSIIIPTRNEAGNIKNLIKRLPHMGKSMELIFVEGHSKDDTWKIILENKNKYKDYKIAAYKQSGIGKADAVRLGVKKASGDIIIILDADLSVSPEELPKFYQALATSKGEFINGTRLVYPLEKQSMRFLNIVGNKIFSIIFSWILDQRLTDTLCGTKAFFRKDYNKIQALRKYFGDFDPFGDYELIFGTVKLNRKVVEVPIRYKARTYGSSNISRFTHGWLLLKMCLYAINKFKMT